MQSVSGIGLALIRTYKQTLSTIKLVNQPTHPAINHRPASEPSRTTHQTTSPVRSARSVSLSSSAYASAASSTISLRGGTPPRHPQKSFRHYAQEPLTMISELFTIRERFATSAAMHMLCMVCAAMAPFMDRWGFVFTISGDAFSDFAPQGS